MHNSLVNSRPVSPFTLTGSYNQLAKQIHQIDVHYSLPKAEEVSGECTREKNQASRASCPVPSHHHQLMKLRFPSIR